MLGNSGKGVFNQTGGIVNVTDTLSIADRISSKGEYNLTDGILKTKSFDIGKKGTGSMLVQNKAEHITTGDIHIYASSETHQGGTYTLDDGSLTTKSLNNEGKFVYKGGALRIKDSFNSNNPALVNSGKFEVRSDLGSVGTAFVNKGELMFFTREMDLSYLVGGLMFSIHLQKILH